MPFTVVMRYHFILHWALSKLYLSFMLTLKCVHLYMWWLYGSILSYTCDCIRNGWLFKIFAYELSYVWHELEPAIMHLTTAFNFRTNDSCCEDNKK